MQIRSNLQISSFVNVGTESWKQVSGSASHKTHHVLRKGEAVGVQEVGPHSPLPPDPKSEFLLDKLGWAPLLKGVQIWPQDAALAHAVTYASHKESGK